MSNSQNYSIETIKLDSLLQKVSERSMAGWRLAQICCTHLADPKQYELSYSFEEGYDILTYRIVIDDNEEVPSITQVYWCAFLYENEMKELFGVNINCMENDYKNKLYRIDEETPFKNKGKEE